MTSVSLWKQCGKKATLVCGLCSAANKDVYQYLLCFYILVTMNVFSQQGKVE